MDIILHRIWKQTLDFIQVCKHYFQNGRGNRELIYLILNDILSYLPLHEESLPEHFSYLNSARNGQKTYTLKIQEFGNASTSFMINIIPTKNSVLYAEEPTFTCIIHNRYLFETFADFRRWATWDIVFVIWFFHQSRLGSVENESADFSLDKKYQSSKNKETHQCDMFLVLANIQGDRLHAFRQNEPTQIWRKNGWYVVFSSLIK